MALASYERSDLNEAKSYFCQTSPNASLVDKPIPDAQIERAFVSSDRPLKDVAKDFAEENKHRGYGYGTCLDGRRYVVSVPASKPVLNRKTLALDHKLLKECQKFELNAILRNQDQPIALDWRKIKASEIAVLSVTCFPKDKPGEGPELWALIGRDEFAVETIKDQRAFFNWVNDRREENGLSPLKLDAKLSDLVARAGTESLAHPHQFLLKAKAELKSSGIEVLGENRAISEDITGIARLFWNSPQHRSLLLNAKANAIGYAVGVSKGQTTIVLILGKIS